MNRNRRKQISGSSGASGVEEFKFIIVQEQLRLLPSWRKRRGCAPRGPCERRFNLGRKCRLNKCSRELFTATSCYPVLVTGVACYPMRRRRLLPDCYRRCLLPTLLVIYIACSSRPSLQPIGLSAAHLPGRLDPFGSGTFNVQTLKRQSRRVRDCSLSVRP
jgi:hypothetical protein